MAGQKIDLGAIRTGPVTKVPGRPDSPAMNIRTELCVANPRNPRDEVGDLEDLASIVERQLQSCLAVTRRAFLALWPEDEQFLDDARYVIVNGNRRLAAAVKYGRPDLIVVVDDGVASSKATLLRAALDENLSRRDFDPIEEAKAVMAVVAQYETAKEAGEAQQWTGAWISQRKSLLKLAPEVQAMVRAKARGGEGIPIRDARWLGSRKGVEELTAEQQLALLRQAKDEESSVKRERAAGVAAAPRVEPPGPVGQASAPSVRLAPASVLEEEAGRERFTAVNSAPPAGEVPEQRAVSAPEASVADGASGGQAVVMLGFVPEGPPEATANTLRSGLPPRHLLQAIDLLLDQMRVE